MKSFLNWERHANDNTQKSNTLPKQKDRQDHSYPGRHSLLYVVVVREREWKRKTLPTRNRVHICTLLGMRFNVVTRKII